MTASGRVSVADGVGEGGGGSNIDQDTCQGLMDLDLHVIILQKPFLLLMDRGNKQKIQT